MILSEGQLREKPAVFQAMTEVLPVVKTGNGSKYVKAGVGEWPVMVSASRSKPVEPAD